MSIIKKTFDSIDHFFLNIPKWFFWGVFFSATWFYLYRKIISWDLWWHMAAGRFIWAKDYYPPHDTFTFSPVKDGQSSIFHVWLGDLVFYFIHELGGFAGLQIFRVLLILLAVFVFISLAKHRYNIWTLLGSIFLVLGTLQKHLIKNAMYSMLFLAIIVLIWSKLSEKRNKWSFFWLASYVAIFSVWGVMHGSTKVGIIVLLCLLVGEIIDQIFDWLRTKDSKEAVVLQERKNNLILLGFLFLVLIASSELNSQWNIKFGEIISSLVSNFVKKSSSSSDGSASSSSSPAQKKENKKEEKKKGFKDIFRTVFVGGDADIVAEYQSPFNIRYVISAKVLFLFSFVFRIYFIAALIFHLLSLDGHPLSLKVVKHLRWSHLIAGLATVYVGLGYLRTIAYPFLIAMPFMAYGLARLPFFEIRHYSLRGLRVFVHVVLAISIFTLCYKQYAYWKNEKFARFSGFIDTEQGYGKTNKFRETMPQYVLKHYPNDKIYNSYNIGGYLIWEWYLDKQVFIDGRSIVYDNDFYEDYKRNAAMKYVKRHRMDKALFSLFVDKDRIALLMRHNWAPVVFDNSMVLLKRPSRIDELYGKVPKFILDKSEVEGMDYVELLGLGIFARNTVNYLLLYGRLKDAQEFIDENQFLFNALDPSHRKDILSKQPFIKNMYKTFGAVNHPKLGALCKNLFQGDKSKSQFYVGETLAFFGKNEEAIREIWGYIQKNKQAHEAYAKLAGLLLRTGKTQDALKAFNQAVKIQPNNAEYLNNLGIVLYSLGAKKEAKKRYIQALTHNPNDPVANFNLGVVYQDLGRINEAVQQYKRVLRLKPDFKQAIERLEKIQGKPKL